MKEGLIAEIREKVRDADAFVDWAWPKSPGGLNHRDLGRCIGTTVRAFYRAWCRTEDSTVVITIHPEAYYEDIDSELVEHLNKFRANLRKELANLTEEWNKILEVNRAIQLLNKNKGENQCQS